MLLWFLARGGGLENGQTVKGDLRLLTCCEEPRYSENMEDNDVRRLCKESPVSARLLRRDPASTCLDISYSLVYRTAIDLACNIPVGEARLENIWEARSGEVEIPGGILRFDIVQKPVLQAPKDWVLLTDLETALKCEGGVWEEVGAASGLLWAGRGKAQPKTYGVTPPIATTPPTEREIQVTNDLVDALKRFGQYESEGEAQKR
ncbi:hypothetical protein BDK51DRAFT_49697 [Blyttiomyces helicus]|uniref:Poly(A) polymerase nucleotidyltransferase domain-containing protein n=1 Tax=Blyttiomyces helicus TaxID=388810 RepID=A0A4P9VVZ4_9FUNG|nr:hypothetical protein BDK51DRAFT_49697 [Blyttiomyces helicus]|eukprot:RKO82833.1 hypothetical protein BDK51DRAFT_49697 [Blyttiomyces helicus]